MANHGNVTDDVPEAFVERLGLNPCGGCGARFDSERCMGCLHDFGTPESAWVRKYAPSSQNDRRGCGV